MVRKILFLFIGNVMVSQVFTGNLHPALQQYLLSGLSQSSPNINYPSVSITKQSAPHNIQSLAALASLLSSSTPALPVKHQAVSSIPANLLTAFAEHSTNTANPNFQSLAAIASLLTPTSKSQAVQQTPNSLLQSLSSELSANAASTSIDTSLLNNLAIALQLLLVSNIINSPQPDTTPEPVVVPGVPIHEFKESVAPISVSYGPQHSQTVTATPMQRNPNYMPSYEHSSTPYQYENQYSNQIPNANFVGSSTFADSNPFGGTIPPASISSSRGGFSLMSPYEALSPSSPFSDPILSSPFGSVITSKKDFQSPYSAIMASENKDLFSFSDFF